MSLILEALKKSEAERLRGRVPGLLDLQTRAPRRRGSGWPLALIGALALVAAGGGAWLVLRDTAPDAPATREAPTPATPAESAASPAYTGEPQVTAPTAQPAAAPSPAPASRLPSDPGFVSIEREGRPQLALPLPAPAPAPAAAEPGAPAPLPAPAPVDFTSDSPAPPAEAAHPADARAAAPRAPDPVAMLPGAGVDATPAANIAGIDAGAGAAAATALPPPLSSLGHEARGRLPPLKVSMHVFAEDPAARVVIIDGRRLREGDAIDSTLRLAEIRREGSVLELDGRRYLLPRP